MKRLNNAKKQNVLILLLLQIVFWGSLLKGANVALTSVWKSSLQNYTDVCVAGRYIYCASNPGGLAIFDGQKANEPVLIGHLDVANAVESVQVNENYAFLNTSRRDNPSKNEVLIVNIANPTAPVVLGRYLQEGYYAFNPLHVNGHYACLGRTILDLSNPAAPTKVGELKHHLNAPYGLWYRLTSVFWRDGFVYLLNTHDEWEEHEFDAYLQVFDMSNPTNPVEVGYLNLGEYYADMHLAGNYAYLRGDKLKIIDISNPAAPVIAGPDSANITFNDIFVSGNKAYITDNNTSTNSGRLQVLDISSKQAPIKLGEYVWSSNESIPANYFYSKVFVQDDFAYIVDRSNRFRIVNISNPVSPQSTGSYASTGMPTASKILLAGNYAYLLQNITTYSSKLLIYDNSNPFAPIWKSTLQFNKYLDGIYISGNYAYINHQYGFFTVNITNPSAPVQASDFVAPGFNSVTTIYASGSHVYVANTESGLLIADVSVPTAPVLKGTWKPGTFIFNVTVQGNYAYVISDNFWRTSHQLSVLDITNPAAPLLVNQLALPEYCNYIYKNGHFLFVGHDYADKKTYVYDISNATNPVRVGDSSVIHSVKDMAFAGSYAFVLGYGGDRISVYDISQTATPVLVGKYYLEPSKSSIAVRNGLVFLNGAEILSYSATTTSPILQVNQKNLYFTAQANGSVSASQPLLISNGGGGNLPWEITLSNPGTWLSCTPMQGSNPGTVLVFADNHSLAAGVYTETITISSPLASNSPQTVTVTFTNKGEGTAHAPFGTVDTPLEGATVSGSIAVTGWALDEQEIKNIQLFVENSNNLTYIGDAIRVYGARPDVQELYPTYPDSARAGWGYMLLTHFLPHGDGTYTIHAVATNQNGTHTTLGKRTITVDNAHSSKPFGAIDTPTQGGIASGKTYINYGWVLTPKPNTIPTNGATIQVWVDGVPIGNPVYNQYRDDIATLFPSYNNSNGAVGYFTLDTSKYQYGVHTIQWSVTDNAGNSEGIGSRYFVVNNSWDTPPAATQDTQDSATQEKEWLEPETVNPVFVTLGYSNQDFNPLFPDQDGVVKITTAELERIEVHFETSDLQAISALPIGSTVDTQQGIFYWQPGAGFIGTYTLDFNMTDGAGKTTRKSLAITIDPGKLKDSPRITQMTMD